MSRLSDSSRFRCSPGRSSRPGKRSIHCAAHQGLPILWRGHQPLPVEARALIKLPALTILNTVRRIIATVEKIFSLSRQVAAFFPSDCLYCQIFRQVSVYFGDGCKFTTIVWLQVRKFVSALQISDLAGDSSPDESKLDGALTTGPWGTFEIRLGARVCWMAQQSRGVCCQAGGGTGDANLRDRHAQTHNIYGHSSAHGEFRLRP